METTAAILLRRTRFSDTSLIVTWLSGTHGRLKTIAKGALRPRNRFAGVLDLFFDAEIAFARSARSELHTLREVSLLDAREGLRRDYRAVELASYFVELVELTVEPEHPVPEVHALLSRALDYLGREPASRRALLHFESELARHLGIHAGGSAADAIFQIAHRLPPARRGLVEKLAHQ